MSAYRAALTKAGPRKQLRVSGHGGVSPYLFLLPAALFVVAFVLYPLVSGVELSMENASSLRGGPFAGIANYRSVIQSGLFARALLNNTEFFAGSLLVLTPVAFVLAMCLYSRRSLGGGAVRLFLLLPLSTSTVTVAIVFSQLFSYRFGLYNLWLRDIGIGAVAWLTNPNVVMVSLVMLAMWGYMGLNVAYILAGLRGIPIEMIEAARIDGAGYLRTIRSVVLPNLRGIVVFVAVQAIVGSYQLFARPDVLTHGGPEDRTFTVVYYIYHQALQNFALGKAAAAGLLVMVVIVVLSGTALAISKVEHHWLKIGSGSSRRKGGET